MRTSWMITVAIISISLAILVIGYVSVSIVMHGRIITPFAIVKKDDIVKKTVKLSELRDREYIICRWARVTGYNYELVMDERGIRSNSFCRVSGIELEGKLAYEFLISDNYFVFYIVDKKEYVDSELEQHVTEYIASGWDVLYPVRRQALFVFAPQYVLVSDLSDR